MLVPAAHVAGPTLVATLVYEVDLANPDGGYDGMDGFGNDELKTHDDTVEYELSPNGTNVHSLRSVRVTDVKLPAKQLIPLL
jgi:hypothetical protein